MDSDAILLGAVGGPKWDNPAAQKRPEQALLALRKNLSLYANLRPVKAFKEFDCGLAAAGQIINGVDLVVVRELTSGIYFGTPSERRQAAAGAKAVDTLYYSEAEISRVVRFAFELARARRKRLASWGQGQYPGLLAPVA